jgi:hypothetical protein
LGRPPLRLGVKWRPPRLPESLSPAMAEGESSWIPRHLRFTAKSVMNLQVTIASSMVTAIKPGGGIRPGLIRLGLHERCGSPHIRERSKVGKRTVKPSRFERMRGTATRADHRCDHGAQPRRESMTLVDTNVLLDIATDDRKWARWSLLQLDCRRDALPPCDGCLYSEFSIGYTRI